MEHPKDERARSVPDADLSFGERFYLREAIKGMGVLAKHFWTNLFGFRDPAPEILDRKGPGVNLVSTINYPDERKPYPPGYRGMHRLVPRVDGKPRCVACYMCATACPAQCIYIEAGEYEDQAIEKFPVRFEIDELRCIVCGFCVEACPKDAIRMDTGTHAPAVLSRPLAVFDKEALLQGPAVEHPSDVLTYRVPLRTPAPREPPGPGVTSKGDPSHR
jgi:NADH-quinone oxidoreductase subunit I